MCVPSTGEIEAGEQGQPGLHCKIVTEFPTESAPQKQTGFPLFQATRASLTAVREFHVFDLMGFMAYSWTTHADGCLCPFVLCGDLGLASCS